MNNKKQCLKWSNVCKIQPSAIKKNLKIEVILIVLMILVLLTNLFFDIDLESVSQYFSDDRLSNITNFLSVAIGIYIAIISILSTTTTTASEIVAKYKLDDDLICIVCAGMFENLVSIILIIFVPASIYGYFILIFFVILISAISLMKFLIFIILLFKININDIAVASSQNKKNTEDIITLLEQIDKNTRQSKQ